MQYGRFAQLVVFLFFFLTMTMKILFVDMSPSLRCDGEAAGQSSN